MCLSCLTGPIASLPHKVKDTPLHNAARNGHADVCVSLVRKGADLNAANKVSDCKGVSRVLFICE